MTEKRYITITITDSTVVTIITPLGSKDQTISSIMNQTDILTTYDDDEINIIVERTKKKPNLPEWEECRNDGTTRS